MKKYWSFFTIEFKQQFAHRGALFVRFGYYGVILFIFSKLWVVVERKSNLELSSVDMLWYLAMTELIVLSFSFSFKQIQDDVHSGNLAYFLTRPASYLWSQYFKILGASSAKFFTLSFAGFFFAYIFTGSLPTHPFGLLLFYPLAYFSIMAGLLFQVGIGLTSFWLQDASPVYWIWQKFNFVLGGMILPLSIYPLWLQKIANYLPFKSFLFAPAMSGLSLDYFFALETLGKLSLWFFLACLLITWLFQKATKSLVLNGG